MAYMANYQEEPELVAEQLREVSFFKFVFWLDIHTEYVSCFSSVGSKLFFTHSNSTSGPYFYETLHMQILI